MRRNKILLGVASLAAASTLLSQTAQADRRTGLAGNLLIQDPDDLFAFPQLTLKHRNMLRIDYGGSADSGNGVFTMGDSKQAFAVALHRGDLLSPDVTGFNQELAWLSGVPNPFSRISPRPFADTSQGAATSTTVVSPSTVADVSYGRAMGNDSLGVRLGFGRGAHVYKADGSDAERGAQTFFAGQFGYSIVPPEGLKLDVSGNVVAAFGRNTDGNGESNDKGFNLRVGGLVRGYYPVNDVLDVGFLCNAAVSNAHLRNVPADESFNFFDLGVMGGVGPAIHLERAKVAAYGGVATTFSKSDDTDNTRTVHLAAPMLNMAAEVEVFEWLYVRTGAQYTWNLQRQKTDTERDRTALGEGYTGVFPAGTASPFVWSAGLGLRRNELYFDGVFQNAFVVNGPNFIGGQANGFLAMASATYRFGDVLNAPKTNSAPAPTPVATRAAPVGVQHDHVAARPEPMPAHAAPSAALPMPAIVAAPTPMATEAPTASEVPVARPLAPSAAGSGNVAASASGGAASGSVGIGLSTPPR
jgi:hypothetical protein